MTVYKSPKKVQSASKLCGQCIECVDYIIINYFAFVLQFDNLTKAIEQILRERAHNIAHTQTQANQAVCNLNILLFCFNPNTELLERKRGTGREHTQENGSHDMAKKFNGRKSLNSIVIAMR